MARAATTMLLVAAATVLLALAAAGGVDGRPLLKSEWITGGRQDNGLRFREKAGTKLAAFNVSVGDSTTLQVELEESSDAGLAVMLADGAELRAYSAPAHAAARMFTGRVKGQANSHVTAILREDGTLDAAVEIDGAEYFVAPTDDSSSHLVYTRDNVKPDTTKSCAAARMDRRRRRRSADKSGDSAAEFEHETPEFLKGSGRTVIQDTKGNIRARRAVCGNACQADLVVDVDYEYFLSRGGNVDRVVADVQAVIAQVNVQYTRDVGIRHRLTGIMVRTTANDPYSSSDPEKMLDEVEAYWANVRAGAAFNPPRDHVQLFTGKEVDSSVIGIAWLSSFCRSYGYSMVQSDFMGNGLAFPYASDLSSHELGHAWGANHCACTSPPTTMNPYITAGNAFDASAANSIRLNRDRATCLDSFSTSPVAPTIFQSTVAPTTVGATTQAPTTQAPTTRAPTTAAPTTAAPATEAPTTKAPTTAAPTTRAPTTAAPTTRAPTTQAPTTQPTTTRAPTTAAPTTRAPTTAAPTTAAPTTQAPTTRAPTTAPPSCQPLRSFCFKSSECCSSKCSWFSCR